MDRHHTAIEYIFCSFSFQVYQKQNCDLQLNLCI